MKKKSLVKIFEVLIVLTCLPAVSAVLTLEPLSPVYNIGDDFLLSIKITSANPSSEFLAVKLICTEGGEKEIYKAFFSLNATETKTLSLPAKFSPSLLSDLKGECFFKASYNKEEVSSPTFEITSQITPILQLETTFIEPGKTLKISGNAIKKNNKPVDGFVKISIPAAGITSSSIVKAGVFALNLTIPENTAAGAYEVKAFVEERDFNNVVTNEGNAFSVLNIKQKPTSLDLALEKIEAYPNSELKYTPLLYDQTGKLISDSIIVYIYSSDNTQIEKKVAISGEVQTFNLSQDAMPGYWKILLQYHSFSTKKEFLVYPIENSSFLLQNDTLIIKNQGNIPFKKIIEVSIGDKKEILDVTIPVGKEAKYKLFAPEREYNISIKSGESTFSRSTFLTGKSIDIKEIRSDKGSLIKLILWAIVIAILIALIILYYKKIKPKTSWETTPKNTEKSYVQNTPKKNYSKFIQEKSGKVEVAVISLNIKNSNKIESIKDSSAKKTLERIFEKIRKEGLKVYNQGAFKIILLPAPSEKEPAPILKALNLAKEIKEVLDEYNEHFALKIKYGIGINKGYMFAETKEGKIVYTSIGSTVVSAKNLSEFANGQVIINEEVYRSALGKVKVEKIGEKRWCLLSIVNRAQYSDFIKKFMNK